MIVGGLLLAVTLLAGPAWAVAPAPLEVKQTRIGLGGRFQVGSWTPVSVTVMASGGVPMPAKLVVIAADPDGQLVQFPGPEVSLTPGQLHTLQGRFFPGRATGDIIVRVETATGYRHDQRFRPATGADPELQPGLRQDVPFWGLCGISDEVFSAAFSDLKNTPEGSGSAKPQEGKLPELIPLLPSDLPSEAADLAALDVIVLAANASVAGSEKRFLEQLTPQQQQAIRDWVQIRGGHLVLSVGSKLNEFQKSQLAAWLKLPLLGETSLRQLDGLESYSPHPAGLQVEGSVSAISVGPIGGTILARSLDGPLLAQMPVGFGRVSFLAVDIDQPPLKSWEGLGHLIRKLLSTERDQIRGARLIGTQLSKSAVNDLSSQLFAAQDEFPRVFRFSLWSVMGLLAVYLLIVGPLDYWIVHRLLNRPHLTWITLAVWVCVGSGLIVGLSNWLNGTQLRSNQLEIVDLDQTTNQLRGQSWLTLYSPRTGRNSVELARCMPDWSSDGEIRHSDPLVSWFAPAENRIGGLYREGGVQLTQREYHATVATSGKETGPGFSDFPLQVWSTGRLEAEWSATAPQLVESNLESSELGRLNGTVTHHLPVTLTDCLLAYANRVYFPVTRRVQGAGKSDLNSHFTWDIGGGQPVEQRDLRSYLTQVYTKEIQRDSKTSDLLDLQTPYDPTRRDQEYIIRMLTFHQAAGGTDYTGMKHDVLANFDLSTHLRLGRAVLMGKLKKSSAVWQVDGQTVSNPESQTFVRIVLPVDRAGEEKVKALPKIE